MFSMTQDSGKKPRLESAASSSSDGYCRDADDYFQDSTHEGNSFDGFEEENAKQGTVSSDFHSDEDSADGEDEDEVEEEEEEEEEEGETRDEADILTSYELARPSSRQDWMAPNREDYLVYDYMDPAIGGWVFNLPFNSDFFPFTGTVGGMASAAQDPDNYGRYRVVDEFTEEDAITGNEVEVLFMFIVYVKQFFCSVHLYAKQ
jgi:hypothetical protein